MMISGRTTLLVAAMAAAVGVLCLAPRADARGVVDKNGVDRAGARWCPPGWREAGKLSMSDELPSRCYPMYANSSPIYRQNGGSCAAGYGMYDNSWCVEGHVEDPELNNPNVISKAHQADRCPSGFHTYKDKCTTDYRNPPKVRVKGSGSCKADEVEEWGIWCTSQYNHLSLPDIRSALYRDRNNIYTFTGGGNPRQGKSTDVSAVYTKMTGGDTDIDGPAGAAVSALVNKRPLTPAQRDLLKGINEATAALVADAPVSAADDVPPAKPGESAECKMVREQYTGPMREIGLKTFGC